MSEEKLKRRRLLADLLFMGGGLTAAALVGRLAVQSHSGPTPKQVDVVVAPTPTPVVRDPFMDNRTGGAVALPPPPDKPLKPSGTR